MKLFLTTLAAISVSSGALAQSHDMASGHNGHAATTAPGAPGSGVIKKTDPKAGTLTLQHGPIPALKWPAMLMPFKADPSLLKGLKAGQKVTFSVKPGATPEIVAIAVVG